MSVTPEIRQQLQTLRIPRDQRPVGRDGRGRRRGGRWVLGLLLLVGAGAGGYYASRHLPSLSPSAAGAAEVRLLKVAAPANADAPPVLTATGKIVSDHRVQVSTKVSGQIVALHFEQGDRVAEGQILARIEDVIYRARRDEAAARLARSRASLDFQKFNHERAAGLYRQSTAPQIEYVDAQRALREAEAQVEADEAALKFAQKALDDCEVMAPIAGVVLERNVEVGDFVAAEGGRGAIANAQFAVIADMTKLRVEVDVSELDIARLHRDMPCSVVPEAYKDRRYHGHVMWIDPGANYSKATVQVKVRISDPDDHLRVEGSAQVAFLPAARPAAPATAPSSVWIPATACRLDTSGTTGKVFIATDGRLKEQSVGIGRRSAGQIEIVSGLSAGESIAAEGLDRLSDGQRIKS